jgi:hypothetical protein
MPRVFFHFWPRLMVGAKAWEQNIQLGGRERDQL